MITSLSSPAGIDLSFCQDINKSTQALPKHISQQLKDQSPTEAQSAHCQPRSCQ